MPISDFEDLNISTSVVIGDWIDIDEVIGQRLHYGPWIIDHSKYTNEYLRLQVEYNGQPRCIMGAYSILIRQCREMTALGKEEINGVIQKFGEKEADGRNDGDHSGRRGRKSDKPKYFYCFVKQPKGANNVNSTGNTEGVSGQILH